MNKKKSIAVAVVLLLVLLIGGLLAYFTDTDNATNNFTLGELEVDISLSEDGWNALEDTNSNNIPDVAENIIPGATITKDPVVNNDSTTNSVCAFVEVVVPAVASDKPIFTYTTNAGWVEVGTAAYDATEGTITHVYAYGTASAMTELEAQDSTNAVFSTVTFNEDLNATDLASATTAQQIDVNAYGIQYANLDSYVPADVWAIDHPNS